MLEERLGDGIVQIDISESAIETSQNERIMSLQNAVGEVLAIEDMKEPPPGTPLVAQFVGTPLVESDRVLEILEPTLLQHDVHAYYSVAESDEDRHIITVINGRPNPKPRPWWPNLVLFILTIISVLFAGSVMEPGVTDVSDIVLWKGWKFASSLLLILGAHELGHYFAARYHKVDVTLPYFIPLPNLIGTMGAFIQLREPMKSRNVLFDVGVAGPLAGLVFAVPILIFGLATSDIHVAESTDGLIREGNSLLYAALKYTVFGKFLPDGNEDVLINQFAFAGWTGLLVTAINLIPIGQLDGGHVMYSLVGRHARRLYWPLMGIMLYLTIYVTFLWAIFTFLLLILGRLYAVPLNDVTPLSPGRRILGITTLIIFVLIFVPNPFQGLGG